MFKYLSLVVSLLSLGISCFLYLSFDKKVSQSLLDGKAIVQSIEYNPETILNAIKTAEAVDRLNDSKEQLMGDVSSDKTMPADLTSGIILKNSTSSNYIIVYSDFECPVCKNVSPLLKKLKDKNLTIILKAVPLKKHQKGKQVAIVFEQMFLANPNLNYFALYELLFSTQELMLKNPKLYIDNLISELRLNKFNVHSKKANERLESYKKEVISFNVNSVPSFNINGNIIQGLPSEEEWDFYINKFVK
jgi:protein-disulfide isomerase